VTETVVIEVTEISNIQSNNSELFNVYPNPVTTWLTIESKEWDQLSVYNLQGKLVLIENHFRDVFEMDCSSWPSGVYLVVINSKFGISIERVVKK
jgi:hypothetical protein